MSESDRWKRVKEVFDAVVASPIEDRAAIVRDLCRGDPALESEVESLLAADVDHGQVLRQSVGGDLRGRVFEAIADVFQDGTRALSQGDRLGTYEVIGFLGAGGMGRVYRARDTTLGRDVALKILPEFLLADPDRRARFEREARLLASLNHPNVGSIYGVHESEPSASSGPGIKALVLELVEGETLADRIARQAPPSAEQRGLPIDEVVGIASQVIDALEAAHERGIVHRDLKPANIKITPEGRVKVLDFGLAKLQGPAEAGHYGGDRSVRLQPDVSASPTVTVGGTRDGVLLGTAPYMSPEQARGKAVDKRTDIWAFGCVLYEMLTGAPAFGGDGVAEVLANVLKAEPDWTKLPHGTPSSIRRLLSRALQKDPARRLRDIGDASYELHDTLESPSDEPPARPSAWRGSVARLLTLTAVVILATAASVAMWLRGGAEATAVTRVIVGWRGETGPRPATRFSLAPDGSRFVYIGPDERLWVRHFEDIEPRALPGTEAADGPFFSPDGKTVAFTTTQGALKVVPVEGGSVRTLITHLVSQGGDWSPDGMIYFSRPAQGVWRVASTGGEAEIVSRPDNAGVTHTNVDVLPNGKGAFVTIYRESANTSEIGVLDFATRKVTALFQGVQARFAATGHVIYTTSDGTLHAAPFDQGRLLVTGSAVPLVENVAVSLYFPRALFAISDTGTLLHKIESPIQSELVWVTKRGVVTPLAPAWTGDFFSLSISPDGTQIAATLTAGRRQDVWTRSLETGALNRLTFDRDGSLNYRAKWTADGRALAFLSNRSGVAGELWRQPADGSAPAERLVSDGPIVDEGFVSPDGQWAVYRSGGSDLVARDIKGVRITGNEARTPKVIVGTSAEEYAPTVSADGRWLAYVSDESGRAEVYVRPFPDTEAAVWQVSHGGGRGPMWSRTGRHLFYESARNELVEVEIGAGATFTWAAPRVLFDLSGYVANLWHPVYDVARDGERFLMARPLGDPTSELVLTLNWFHEVTRALQGPR